MNKKYTILYGVLFLFFILPAQAQSGTQFTVYGQVLDTDGTPLNGITVNLSVSGGTINTTTANATLTNGSSVAGYYILDLANLPVSVSQGTSMTLTAATTGKSASTVVARAAAEPQRIDLRLSISGAVPTPTPTPIATPTPTPGGPTPTPTPTPGPGQAANMSWRFISVPFLLDNSSVNNVLAGIDYDMLSAWDPVQKIWTAPVMNLEPLHGYLIHMNESQQITNLVRKSGPIVPPSMDVLKGWNLIGTPGNMSLDAETMLGSIDNSYFNIWNWNVSQQTYDRVGVNGKSGVLTPPIVGTDVFTMQPVVSYWVWVTQNNTLPAFST